MDRRAFVRATLAGTAALALAPYAEASALRLRPPPSYDFRFTRLMYESGDWDVDQRMPSNLLNSLVEYTTLRVDPKEHVVALADPRDARLAPFCYLAGHKLVRVQRPASATQLRALRAQRRLRVRRRLQPRHRRPVRQVVRGRDGRDLRRRARSRKLPNDHPLYRSFFTFPDGPPATGIRAERLGRRPRARLPARASRSTAASALLYSNKDYGCEWDYDWRNKRFLAEDNTKFAVNIVLYAIDRLTGDRHERRRRSRRAPGAGRRACEARAWRR